MKLPQIKKGYLVAGVIVLLSLAVSISKAQTKQETQDWLLFYLGKYTGHQFEYVPFNNDLAQDITNDSYFFRDNYLYVYEQRRFYAPMQKIDSMMDDKIYRLDLRDINKVSYTIIKDTFPDFMARIDINFACCSNKYPTVVVEDKLKKGERYVMNEIVYSIYTDNKEILQQAVINRIAKALEHLGSVCGSNVIKDFF